jgi:arsenical pump membrane protein
VVGVAGALARPWQLPAWVFPAAAAVTTVAVVVLGPIDASHAVGPLLAPIAFLRPAVPLAVLSDELDLFDALARVAGGRHVAAGMWVLTAAAVAVLNLDAAVVLCPPLAVTVARRWQLDPVAMAFQPALLACLASSALSVSNLTNLIAVDQGLPASPTRPGRADAPTAHHGPATRHRLARRAALAGVERRPRRHQRAVWRAGRGRASSGP